MDIRIAQFFFLTTRTGATFRYQNYFVPNPPSVKDETEFGGSVYTFAPFRAEGSSAGLNGENNILQILFPNTELSLRLLQSADGNRLSRLQLATVWVNSAGLPSPNQYIEYLVGIGSSVSETTLELRFRSAIDSVVSNFPARSLNRTNVGILPLDSQISMR